MLRIYKIAERDGGAFQTCTIFQNIVISDHYYKEPVFAVIRAENILCKPEQNRDNHLFLQYLCRYIFNKNV